MATTKTQITDYTQEAITALTLNQIAYIINKDWRKTAKNGIYFGAKPYIEAMECMVNISDNYIVEKGTSIVNYFLANSQTWKGEVAKAIKAELNRRVKAEYSKR